jgi:hypothetical protein
LLEPVFDWQHWEAPSAAERPFLWRDRVGRFARGFSLAGRHGEAPAASSQVSCGQDDA